MGKGKRKNSNKPKKVNKEKAIEEVKQSGFKGFINNKAVKIIIHIITVITWIFFIEDMATFTSRGTSPNIILSILALVTFILEWNVMHQVKK